MRLDVWSPDYWADLKGHHAGKRVQMERPGSAVRILPADVDIVVGGDFDLPADSALFKHIATILRDAFVRTGVGWGGTFPNDMPVHRIDRIWGSRRFRAVRTQACATEYSVHRMVAVDFAIADERPPPRR